MDRQMEGQMDGHNLLLRCVFSSEKLVSVQLEKKGMVLLLVMVVVAVLVVMVEVMMDMSAVHKGGDGRKG